MTMTKSSSINQPHHNCHRCHQYISPSPWANSPLINHPWRYCCLIIIFAKVNFTNQFYNNAWTLNIEHWPITYWQSTAQPVFSKSEQKSPNCKGLDLNFLFLFFVNSRKDPWVMKAVAQQLMFFLPARTQSTSDPHLEPVFWPLGGLFCPAWLLGGLLLVFGLFPLGLLRRPSVLGTFWEFENLGSFSGQFYQFSFLFPPLGLPVCAGHLRSRFFSQTSRQLILTARHQSFQNFDFLSSSLRFRFAIRQF